MASHTVAGRRLERNNGDGGPSSSQITSPPAGKTQWRDCFRFPIRELHGVDHLKAHLLGASRMLCLKLSSGRFDRALPVPIGLAP
jgi:hypothetical protein